MLAFSDVNASDVSLSRSGASDDLLITDTVTGNTLTVKGQFNPYGLGPLQSFTFADGTVWSAQQVKQMLLDQESAQAGGSIYGYANTTDTLVAGLGDQYLAGEGGTNTYVYSSAGGNDVIDDGGSALAARVQRHRRVGRDLQSQFRLRRSADHRLAGTGKTITVRGQFNPYGLGPLQSFAFADGTVLSASEVKQIVDQGSGNVVFDKGDGHITVRLGSATTVAIGPDIADNDVVLQADSAGDLIVRLLDSNDSLTIANDLSGQWWGIASELSQISFADGTSISLNRDWSQPFTLTWLGEAGNMTLTGAGFGNTISWLGPGDVVSGCGGWFNT